MENTRLAGDCGIGKRRVEPFKLVKHVGLFFIGQQASKSPSNELQDSENIPSSSEEFGRGEGLGGWGV